MDLISQLCFLFQLEKRKPRMLPKEKDYTTSHLYISKDAKVRHLLLSARDNVMSNRVIGCKTAEEI